MSWARALVASLILLSTAPAADAAVPSWIASGSTQFEHMDAAAVAIAGGDSALVIGGLHWTGTAHDAQTFERYDRLTNRWTTLGRLPERRRSSGAVTLRDGRVLVAGGWNYPEGEVATADLYDPATDTWSDAQSMQRGRGSFALVLLDDGKALAVGGSWSPIGPEVYDPVTDTWTATEGTGLTGLYPAAAKLPDGRVLAAGGVDVHDVKAEAKIYDPQTNTWTPVADMHLPRHYASAATLPDGRVLVAGGYDRDDPPSRTARTFEIYDPATDTWTEPGPLNRPRANGAQMVTLSDGRLVITGGHSAETEYGVTEATAEVYDPRTGTWTSTPAAGIARSGHVAVALADDSVLVAGGVYVPLRTERLVFPEPAPEPDPTPTPTPVAEVKAEPAPIPSPNAKPAPGKATVTVARTLKTSRAGALSLKVRCIGASACPKQRLELRVRGGKLLARADVSLAARATRTVTLKLKRADRRERTLKVVVSFAGVTYNRSLQVRWR